MIHYIEGNLISKNPTTAIIETVGLAFEINITLSVYDKLPDVNNKTKILTYFHIRENPFSFVLYGFSDEAERECFKSIISVSGLGPRIALNVLSGLGYKEFTHIILSGDLSRLTNITGIGKKTAERMGIELKDKLSKSADGITLSKLGDKGIGGDQSKLNEIVMVLLSLGYSRPEAENLIRKFYSQDEWKTNSIEDIVKLILRGK